MLDSGGALEAVPYIGGRRVLLVDQDPTVGNVVRELIGLLGYHVVQCATAETALGWCRTGKVDAVLTEVGLHSHDGRSFASALSAQHPDLPVAVLTGWLDHPEARYIDRRGQRMVLGKPIRLEDLDIALRSLTTGFCGI